MENGTPEESGLFQTLVQRFKTAALHHLSSLGFKNTHFPLSNHPGHDGQTEQDEFILPNTPNSDW